MESVRKNVIEGLLFFWINSILEDTGYDEPGLLFDAILTDGSVHHLTIVLIERLIRLQHLVELLEGIRLMENVDLGRQGTVHIMVVDGELEAHQATSSDIFSNNIIDIVMNEDAGVALLDSILPLDIVLEVRELLTRIFHLSLILDDLFSLG